jgi:hypothetical protein
MALIDEGAIFQIRFDLQSPVKSLQLILSLFISSGIFNTETLLTVQTLNQVINKM